MINSSVDKRYAVPLYHQILLLLRDEIQSGIHPLGAKMPTEEQLARCHGVSRITARRALKELAGLGLVERRRRVGTRVTYYDPLRPVDGNMDQAVEAVAMSRLDPGVELLEVSDCAATETLAQHLAIAAGEPLVCMKFLKSDEFGPFGEVTTYTAKARGVPTDRQSLLTHPMPTLVGFAGYSIRKSIQSVFAGSADAAMAALLHMDIHAPILRVERTCLQEGGQPLLFTAANYRGDRYRISVDVQTLSPAANVPNLQI